MANFLAALVAVVILLALISTQSCDALARTSDSNEAVLPSKRASSSITEGLSTSQTSYMLLANSSTGMVSAGAWWEQHHVGSSCMLAVCNSLRPHGSASMTTCA
jgi:hypothetical protein